jgi:hypothetical protein
MPVHGRQGEAQGPSTVGLGLFGKWKARPLKPMGITQPIVGNAQPPIFT